ncbi:MAG: hypothetical protein ACR2G3_00245 [Solirubrobacterales bacterium]
MTEKKQKTQPRGKDKRTGEPAKPLEIPVPKRKAFDALLQRVSGGKRRSGN